MSGEKMTPSQRWKTILAGDPVDRCPIYAYAYGHTAMICGYQNLGAYWEKPEVSYNCQRIARELYGWEQAYSIMPPGYGAAEWGSKILFPYNPKMGSVAVLDSVVKTPDDVEKIEVPEPKNAAYYQELTQTLKKIVAQKEIPIIFITGGWITWTAPMIAHLDTFMRWLTNEPSLAKKLLAKSREFGVRIAEHFVKELGSDTWVAFDGCPTDSNNLVSPKMFGEFVLPNVIEMHQKVLDMGVIQWCTHWCGNHNGNLKAGHIDKIPMGKPGIQQFGPETDLSVIVERFGKKNIVMGNVDPPSMLIKSHEEVLQLAKQDIDKGKYSPKGYILGVGCETPPRAPPANVYALVKAAREYGRD
jgi:uroporphyrinogen decarboxylase